MQRINALRSLTSAGQRITGGASCLVTHGGVHTFISWGPAGWRVAPEQGSGCRPSSRCRRSTRGTRAVTLAAPGDALVQVQEAVARVSGLSSSCRVICVSAASAAAIPTLQARGVQDVLVVDTSAEALDRIRAQFSPDLGLEGNVLGVRTWQGDVQALPNYLGWAADVFVVSGKPGSQDELRATLLKACLQIKPGGHIIVSCIPVAGGGQPTTSTSRAALEAVLSDLPLRVLDYAPGSAAASAFVAVLQVPALYRFPGAPLRLNSRVVAGFGRGSRQLGTPTANLDPGPLQEHLAGLPRGVYYGWARVVATSGQAGLGAEDLQVHKAVMNVGRRPTVNTGDEAPTVEVHLLHDFRVDFYGAEAHVLALGYIRPELKFPGGLPELQNRIRLDVAVGRNLLDDPDNQQFNRQLLL